MKIFKRVSVWKLKILKFVTYLYRTDSEVELQNKGKKLKFLELNQICLKNMRNIQ